MKMKLNKINTVAVHVFVGSVIVAAILQALSFVGIAYILRDISTIINLVITVPAGSLTVVLSLYKMSLKK